MSVCFRRALFAAACAIVVPTALPAEALIPSAQELYGPPIYGSVSRALKQADNDVRPPSGRALTLTSAVRRALAANPKLTAAERDIGIASGKRIQAGAIRQPRALL